ncbi:hypothetical protein AVEN_162695-1 [Araneus ventricosus]|uniref:Uncharacterized protein n=1 Tax=Araneus ventricosus TaxID=182803 RepID=A0A4Y2URS3_ARAVE|nr:hypothetical protein AVEN_162695-1 [Araneus ventricosus]
MSVTAAVMRWWHWGYINFVLHITPSYGVDLATWEALATEEYHPDRFHETGETNTKCFGEQMQLFRICVGMHAERSSPKNTSHVPTHKNSSPALLPSCSAATCLPSSEHASHEAGF